MTRPSAPTPRTRRVPWLLLVAVVALFAAGCSSSGSSEGSAGGEGSTTDPSSTDGSASEPGDADDGRVVAIGEEYVLADLLSLGVRPVASTATVDDAGFQGVDEFDTDGIEPLPATEANLERLAGLRPDHIVVLQFFADEIGMDKLQGIAGTVTVVPDGLGPVEQIELLAEAFDRGDAAADLIAEYDTAMEGARTALDGQQVSVAAIYGGPSLAAFVEGPWAVPATLLESGATLLPSPEGLEVDQNGRAHLSLERLDLLSAPTLLLLTSPLVEGEADAISQVQASPLWASLPAVEGGTVIEMDRLGYPGLAGRIRLADDLAAELG